MCLKTLYKGSFGLIFENITLLPGAAKEVVGTIHFNRWILKLMTEKLTFVYCFGVVLYVSERNRRTEKRRFPRGFDQRGLFFGEEIRTISKLFHFRKSLRRPFLYLVVKIVEMEEPGGNRSLVRNIIAQHIALSRTITQSNWQYFNTNLSLQHVTSSE